MTDGKPQPDDVDEAVRGLLRAARVEDPVPPEVADRIDRALAGARPPAQAAHVVRFRRRLAGGLVAAAVVVVGGGAVVAQLRDSGGGADTTTSSVAGSGPASDAATESGGRGAKATPQDVQPAATPSGQPLSGSVAREALPRLRTAHFAADVRALVGGGGFALEPKTTRSPTDSLPSGAAASDCTPPPGLGTRAHAREVALDGRLATLVVDPPDASPRTATAWSCDGRRALARTVLDG